MGISTQKGALIDEVTQVGASDIESANDSVLFEARDYKALHAGNQRRLARISLALQCLPVLSCLQQHRGSSLAVLNGDLFFESRILGIQNKVEVHIERVQTADEFGFLDNILWDNVLREWSFIQTQWRKDSPLTNFNLHCHLINELILFIKSVLFHEELGTNNDSLLLLGYVVESLLPTLEGVAQIRGLSTHRELDENPDQDVVFRLNYLVTEFKQRQSGIIERCDAFSTRDSQLIMRCYAANQCNVKFTDLFGEIENAKSHGWRCGYGSGSLFLSATKLIDALLSVTDCSIKRLRDHMDGDLQRWIYRL